jgi:isoleucyl-tRNA synthetase
MDREMRTARGIAAEGLKLRAEAGIKVRQPLREFQISNSEFRKKPEFLELIKEEVNVKEIIFGKETRLDTMLTPELREEGIMREFIRTIQETRRDLGFSPKDGIRCLVDGDAEMLTILSRHESMIKRETGMREFGAGKKTSKPASEKQIDFGGKILRIQIMK